METTKIKIHYQTGNSFGSEECEEYLDYEFATIELAKENLKRIGEHYIMYKELNSYSHKISKEEIFDKNKDKSWFVLKYTKKMKLMIIMLNI